MGGFNFREAIKIIYAVYEDRSKEHYGESDYPVYLSFNKKNCKNYIHSDNKDRKLYIIELKLDEEID